jgi:hypothetical protein
MKEFETCTTMKEECALGHFGGYNFKYELNVTR